MRSAIVLLSGGQDSTTCLFWAKQQFERVRALSIWYGQRHEAELVAASRIAEMAGVPHEQFTTHLFSQLADSALVNGEEVKASGGYADAHAPNGLPTSFVPGRNMLMLTMAAAYAVKQGAKHIVTGVCQTDYSGYPDCREEFVKSFAATATLAMPSGCGPLEVHTPLMHLSKAETVVLARKLPGCWEALALTVTCYNGKRPGCGACPSCTLRRAGFAQAHETDPST